MSELSLSDTHELADILEARDWALLDDFIARRGVDENVQRVSGGAPVVWFSSPSACWRGAY